MLYIYILVDSDPDTGKCWTAVEAVPVQTEEICCDLMLLATSQLNITS